MDMPHADAPAGGALPVRAADIDAAAHRLEKQVLDTPCVESRTLGDILGCRVFLKFENLQFTASFKERGALNKLAALVESGQPLRGVIAASAGNHAQGVAHHAQRLGLRAVIVMPVFTPTVKVERTRGFGAEVVLHGQTFDEAHEHALAFAGREGLSFVHPYDDPLVIAGQGTIGQEMLRAHPDLDTLVVSIGGGGLISGIATAARAIAPGIEIVGVQAEGELWVDDANYLTGHVPLRVTGHQETIERLLDAGLLGGVEATGMSLLTGSMAEAGSDGRPTLDLELELVDGSVMVKGVPVIRMAPLPVAGAES